MEFKSQTCDMDKTPEKLVDKHDLGMHVNEVVTITNIDYNHILFNEENNQKSIFNRVQTDDIDSEPDNYVDTLNTIESKSENDIDYITKREVQQLSSCVTCGTIENGVIEALPNLLDNNLSDVVSKTDYVVPLNEEKGNLADSLQENHVLDLVSKSNASNLGYVSPSHDLDRENMTRDNASLNKEPFRDLFDSLQAIPPLTSKPHASNLGPVSPSDVPYKPHASNLGPGHPSDVPYGEEMTRDIACLNKETFRYLPDSMQEIPPLTIEPHTSNLGPVNSSNAPYSEEMTTNNVSLNKEMFGNLPNSLQETPALTLEPYASNLASVRPLDISVSKGIAKNIVDSYPSKTLSLCTDTYIGSSIVNDTMSAPIETNISFSSSNNSNLPNDEVDKNNKNIYKSEETSRESLANHFIRFWTNGGLLGLEPSKPSDFNKSTSLSQGSLSTKSETNGGSHHNSMQKSNGYKKE
ncbi:hypothetical protein JHK82_027325 [Glycine max]|nr:hypothetical protein JHK82_027325 [Glycine max]